MWWVHCCIMCAILADVLLQRDRERFIRIKGKSPIKDYCYYLNRTFLRQQSAHIHTGGFPSEYRYPVWYGKKLEWCGYPTVKKFRRYVYSFWHDPRTWQTDGQTDRRMGGWTLENDTGTGAWPHYRPAKYILVPVSPSPTHSRTFCCILSPSPPRYRACRPHPHPVTAESCKQEHPIPRHVEDDGYILTLCPYVLRFYLDLCKQFLLSAFCV